MSSFQRLAAGWPGPSAPLRVLSASGQLGLGIPEAAFREGVSRRPHVIAADMGSIDPGPAYLGSGTMAGAPALVRRDLEMVLTAARELDAPLLIGSAGTAGAAPQLAAVREILVEIAHDRDLDFRLASISADIPHATVTEALADDRLHPIGTMSTDAEAIAETPHVVGQMGMAPFRQALEGGADVILAGRACDTAPFAVVPVLLGYPAGPAMHMAKILECSSICCTPGGRDAMLATLEGDGFTLESMNPDRAATPLSVAAHALYEQADPARVFEPEGHVRLDGAAYEAVDARRTRVTGATWHDASVPSVKIEGARQIGHRALVLAGAADPVFIAQSGEIVARVIEATRALVPPDPAAPWTLGFRRYGIDGVLDWPDAPESPPREIFLLGECIAPDPETARAAAAAARQQLLHFGFEGRRATGGNLAFPVTPPEVSTGPAFTFTLYHVLELPDRAALDALFPVTFEDIAQETP